MFWSELLKHPLHREESDNTLDRLSAVLILGITLQSSSTLLPILNDSTTLALAGSRCGERYNLYYNLLKSIATL
jgi:hypothetical protein